MAASLVLTIKTDRSDASSLAVDSSKDKEGVMGLRNFLDACMVGAAHASVDVQYTDSTAPVAASATATLVSVVAGDALTIGGVTLTSSATPVGEAQWSQAGTDAADATALAACINAHSTLSKVVSASAASNVVTMTCLQKGVVGNFITVSRTGTAITLSGSALGSGAGGAQSAAKTYSCGLT